MQPIEVEILKKIEIDLKSVSLRSDGIVHVSINTSEDVEVKDVIEIVAAVEEIGNGKKFPLLIKSQKYTLPSAEARAYIATPESNPFASAEAYVIQSFSQKLVGNIFISFNKPARPTRIFTSEEKAIEWLQTFLQSA